MIEREYKFDIPFDFHKEEFIDDIQNSIDGIKSVEFSGRKEYRDIYYDTRRYLLFLAGFSCRIRYSSKIRLEIKFEPKDTENLYITRSEWIVSEKERKQTGKVRFEGKKVRKFFIENFQYNIPFPFFPFVIINSVREKYVISYKRIKCELSFDYSKGSLVNSSSSKKHIKTFSFTEMEIELLDSENSYEEDFAELGKIIEDKFSLKPVFINKLKRVLKFFKCNPLKTDRYKICFNDSPDAGLEKIVSYYFEIAMQNRAGCEIGIDSEYVHDMRVALRKIRTALQCFRDYIGRREYLYLKNNCKWIAFFLGKVRDCDVYKVKVLNLLPEVREKNSNYEMKYILEELNRIREENRRVMKLNFKSRRYKSFVLKFEGFCKNICGLKNHKEILLRDLFQETLNKILKSLKKNIKRVRNAGLSADDIDIHRLRINFKKLRYTFEFFADLLNENQRMVRQKLPDIQNALGDYVDTFFILDLTCLLEERIGSNRYSREALILLKNILKSAQKHKDELKKNILSLLDGFVSSSEYISLQK